MSVPRTPDQVGSKVQSEYVETGGQALSADGTNTIGLLMPGQVCLFHAPATKPDMQGLNRISWTFPGEKNYSRSNLTHQIFIKLKENKYGIDNDHQERKH